MMIAIKRCAVTLLLILTSVSLSGCWSKVEVNERTFITGLYIDRAEDGQVEVTISAPLPNRLVSQVGEGGSQGGRPYAILSKTARTIPEALEAMQIDLSRKLSWGHTRVLTVGESYARAGVEELLDWINHEPLFHLSSFLNVAEGKAKDITKLTPVYEESPSEVLREFSNQHNLISTQVQDMMTSNALDLGATTPLLKTEVTEMVSENNKPSIWAGQRGGAMFLDGRMVDTLDIHQTYAVAWARNELDQLYLSVEKENHVASLKVYELEGKLKVHKENGKPVFKVLLKGKGAMRNNMPDHLSDLEYANALEVMVEQQITGYMESALKKARKHGADILLLAYRLEWKYPKLWKEYQKSWIDYVKDSIDIRVTTDINLQYFGSKSPD
ncbi:Ger(x)C family spore germination protein [Paenibacillus daejeonensis]|uniref:Ger(x)C family spore germination protein n=1 Tax=Paenibacillus daejeonensis TaxID=135193 RepID=UPI00036C11D9|nr:Ger(x)C family spore germination protein [Paenibacillus daejeonensis]